MPIVIATSPAASRQPGCAFPPNAVFELLTYLHELHRWLACDAFALVRYWHDVQQCALRLSLLLISWHIVQQCACDLKLASRVFSIDSADILRPITAAEILARRSAVCFRPIPAADRLARCSLVNFLPIPAADILARASGVCFTPKLLPAFAAMLYPCISSVDLNLLIQTCSREIRSSLQSTCSKGQNSNASGPYLFHAFCRRGELAPRFRSRLWTFHLPLIETADPM